MRRLPLLALALAVLVLALPAGAQAGLSPHRLRVPTMDGPRDVTLWVADGLDVSVFASGLKSARMLAESPTGELVLSEEWVGQVVKLADRNGDGVADEVVPILTNLNVPHGVGPEPTRSRETPVPANVPSNAGT